MISIPLSLAIGVAAAALHRASASTSSASSASSSRSGCWWTTRSWWWRTSPASCATGDSRARGGHRGHPPDHASRVLGCTATLLFAFLPLLFLPGTRALFIRSMPVAVVYTVARLAVRVPDHHPVPRQPLLRRRKSTPRATGSCRALHRAIDLSYRRLLHRALRAALAHAWASRPAALRRRACALVPLIGFSLFPKAGHPQFLVDGRDAGRRAASRTTDRAVRFVEDELARPPRGARAGAPTSGEGNPRIYYNIVPEETRSPTWPRSSSELHDLRPRGAWPRLHRRAARAASPATPARRIQVKEFENGPPARRPGRDPGHRASDLDVLEHAGGRRWRSCCSATPGHDATFDNPAASGSAPTCELRSTATRRRCQGVQPVGRGSERCGWGWPVCEVGTLPRRGPGGRGVRHQRACSPGSQDRPTPRRAGPGLRHRHARRAGAAAAAPAPRARVGAEPRIHHYNTRAAASPSTADVRAGYNTDKVTRAVLAKLARPRRCPPGYRIVRAGEYESARRRASAASARRSSSPRSACWRCWCSSSAPSSATLIVASVIPLGIVGGLLALLLTGQHAVASPRRSASSP